MLEMLLVLRKLGSSYRIFLKTLTGYTHELYID